MNENKELNKVRMLFNAVQSLEQNEEDTDFVSDLKDAAWNVLHENPGSEFGDWQATLIQQYPTEVVDALGTTPEDVYAQLADWWKSMEYDDEATGICERFCDWAEYFANEKTVELHDRLAEKSQIVK